MLSDEGVAILCRRGFLKPDRTGTIVGLKGNCYVVHWDDNAKQTVKPYARQYIKIIQPRGDRVRRGARGSPGPLGPRPHKSAPGHRPTGTEHVRADDGNGSDAVAAASA